MAEIPRRRTLAAALAALAVAAVPTALPVRAAAAGAAPTQFRLLNLHAFPRQDALASVAGGQGVSGPNPACSVCSPPLLFGGSGTPVAGGLTHTSGPVGQVTVVPYYWDPTPYAYTTNYKSIVNGYFSNLAADSGKTTNVFSVATEYYQTFNGPTQYIEYQVTLGAPIDDSNAFPTVFPANTTGCVPNATKLMTACVSDHDLGNELVTNVANAGLPTDDSHIYMVFFPNHVETCQNPGVEQVCSTNTYCAYHAGLQGGGLQFILYGNEPFPDLNACTGGAQAPNGDSEADAVISSSSHEVNETITDAFGAWMDSAGYENGDECAYTFGTALGGSSGTYYNQVINGAHYWTQMEWSNNDFAHGVGQQISPANSTLVPGCVQAAQVLGPRADVASPSNSPPGSRPDPPSSTNSAGSRTEFQGTPIFGALAAPVTTASAATPSAPSAATASPAGPTQSTAAAADSLSGSTSSAGTPDGQPLPASPAPTRARPRPGWPVMVLSAVAMAFRDLVAWL